MKYLHHLLALSGIAPLASAATIAVLPGEVIQSKIDAAAPGDIIAIFGGTYPGDVSINKAVRLVEVDGQDVTITGNVTWSGVTNAPPFEGFAVGSSGKGMTVTNTTGLVVKNVDAKGGFGLVTNTNSRVDVIGGQFSAISQDGGNLSCALTQVNGAFGVTANALKTTIFRSTISGTITCNAKKCWIGYCNAYLAVFGGTGNKVMIVGSQFDGRGTYGDVIDFAGNSNTCALINSKIIGACYGGQGGPGANVYPGRGCVRIQGSNFATILNNYMKAQVVDTYLPYSAGGGSLGYAVKVDASGNSSQVANNIFQGHYNVIQMPFGCRLQNNYFHAVGGQSVLGGVVAENSYLGDPLFVNGQAPLLQSSSPCVNAGVSDPSYDDLDGTRNDIGPGGGCMFDPQGWTTNKPVVISFDLAPQQLLKGVDTQVNLSNGEAVAQP